MLAVALIDGALMPEQFARSRIVAPNVQHILRKVTVTPIAVFTALFPNKLPARLEIEMDDGSIFMARRDDYRGFYTKPFAWADAREKCDLVVSRIASPGWSGAVAEVVSSLDERPFADLIALLEKPTNR